MSEYTKEKFVNEFQAVIENNPQFAWIRLDIALAQAIHETGNFKSVIFRENNNLFGMKLPRVRETTATGENRAHATYETTKDSIKDYCLYLMQWSQTRPDRPYKNAHDAVKYLQAIVKASYAEDANYFKKVLRHYENLVETFFENIKKKICLN